MFFIPKMRKAKYCTYCGEKIILIEIKRGTHSKYPEYFDEITGQRQFHEVWKCPNAKVFDIKHTEYFINTKDEDYETK